MKLVDLNPRWIGHGGEGVFDKDDNPIPFRDGIGISCSCPCGCRRPLFVPFRNPLDGGPPYTEGTPLWDREGDNFETLTLSPSILRVKINGQGCGWHGFIKNGEIIVA